MKYAQLSMTINHEPADQLYIDFAGKTWEVYDQEFGKSSSKSMMVGMEGKV